LEGPTIQQGICSDQRARDRELVRGREAGGINERDEVVVDEAARITGLAGGAAQGFFERRERADPVRRLDPDRPRERRQVQPGEASAAPTAANAMNSRCTTSTASAASRGIMRR
jgi:hypothetical protein